MNLTNIPINQWHSVAGLNSAENKAFAGEPNTCVRLQALGFVTGEAVRILRRSWLKQGPLVVQIGNATFALRQDEARHVDVVNLVQAS
ncbi:ferrous iron transport protein A [Comamonadaceae bacterium M7527]|nr:ferrous iron transport protein A [Comamonadaceae bacterium M7527]